MGGLARDKVGVRMGVEVGMDAVVGVDLEKLCSRKMCFFRWQSAFLSRGRVAWRPTSDLPECRGLFLFLLVLFFLEPAAWHELKPRELPVMPSRSGHTAIAYNTLLCIFGGHDGQDLGDLWLMDPGVCCVCNTRTSVEPPTVQVFHERLHPAVLGYIASHFQMNMQRFLADRSIVQPSSVRGSAGCN